MTTLGKLYPFGYAAPDAQQRLDVLMRNEKTLLVDIRYRPYSQRREWQRQPLMVRYGSRYRSLGSLLGNENYRIPLPMPIKLAYPDAGLRVITPWIEAGYNLVLLCVCAEYDTCHRRTVVDLIRGQLPTIEVEQPEPIAISD